MVPIAVPTRMALNGCVMARPMACAADAVVVTSVLRAEDVAAEVAEIEVLVHDENREGGRQRLGPVAAVALRPRASEVAIRREDAPQPLDDHRLVLILEDVVRDAERQCFLHRRFVFLLGHDHHGQVLMARRLANVPQDVQSAQGRNFQVEDDGIHAACVEPFERGDAVVRLDDDALELAQEYAPEHVARRWIAVGEQHGNLPGHGRTIGGLCRSRLRAVARHR